MAFTDKLAKKLMENKQALDEISAEKLKNYLSAAQTDLHSAAKTYRKASADERQAKANNLYRRQRGDQDDEARAEDTMQKRQAGIKLAHNQLKLKEDSQPENPKDNLKNQGYQFSHSSNNGHVQYFMHKSDPKKTARLENGKVTYTSKSGQKMTSESVEFVTEATTRNAGYGYHGEAYTESMGKNVVPNYDHSKYAAKKFAQTHDLVKKVTGASPKEAREYLDSVHGRHLFGNENEAYIKKDYAHYKKRLRESVEVEKHTKTLSELAKHYLDRYLTVTESAVDGREKAMMGVGLHSKDEATKFHKKLVDFYEPKAGDKKQGMIQSVDKDHYKIKEVHGPVHTFKYRDW